MTKNDWGFGTGQDTDITRENAYEGILPSPSVSQSAADGDDWGFGSGGPVEAAVSDSPLVNQIYQGAKTIGLKTFTTAGKVLQPFAAPQQVLFGGIGAIGDLIRGDTAKATETWNRGIGAAADYATWGITAKYAGDRKDARNTAILGFELAKKANAPDWLARPLGMAADFFLDVPLIGQAGRAAKLDTLLDVTMSVDRKASENMARAFYDPATKTWDSAGVRKFAARLAAAPLSTAPIRDLFVALPAGYRENLGKRAAAIVEEGMRVNLRGKDYTVGGGRGTTVQGGRQADRTQPLGATLGTLVFSRFGNIRGLPTWGSEAFQALKEGRVEATGMGEKVKMELFKIDSIGATYQLRASESSRKYNELITGMPQQAADEFNKIAAKILDWKDPADMQEGLRQLEAFSASRGVPGFKEQALDALHSAAALDTYTGLLRFQYNGMGMEKASSNYQGLRRFERAAFGQPKTANPMAQGVARKAINARAAGDDYEIPEASMHFRRSFGFHFNPIDVVDQIRSQALPPQIMDINDDTLAQTVASRLKANWVAQNPTYSMQRYQAARTALDSRAVGIAQGFKQWWTNPNMDERLAFSTYLQQHQGSGLSNKEILEIMDDIGGKWYQNGITYRPPAPKVARIIQDMVEEERAPYTSGSSGADLATNRAVLSSRTDIPEWLRESMQQNYDVAELLEQSVNIGVKQFKNRSSVQVLFDELQREGGILKKDDFDALQVQHNNWRRVTPQLAAQLKAIDGGGQWGDLPFKGDEYIPAAFHEMLVGFTRMDEGPMKFALMQHLLTAWKAHKVASPAGIVRDAATNYRLASDMGISPIEMSRAFAAAVGLRNTAVKHGMSVLDEDAYVKYGNVKVTWKEIAEQGFIHGTFVQQEVDDVFRQLRNDVASARGDGFQGVSAALIDAADRFKQRRDELIASGSTRAKAGAVAMTGAAAAVDVATGLGGPVTRKLADFKGMVDQFFKAGVYIHRRNQGDTPEIAARYADELFFNYANQPIMVDVMRRTGISPFAAFQFMSSGRFFRTMYENPYAVQRWYRLPNSAMADDERTRGEYQYTAPEFMRKQLWVPLALPGVNEGKVMRDSEGRSMFFNLASVMPESSVFSMTGTDAVTQWVPPYIELYQQIMTGQGYQGMPLYNGGGSLAETLQSGNKLEVARGIVKALHQFGASPWSPGSPMAERMAKSIVDAGIDANMLDQSNPQVQALLRFNTHGAFAAPLAPGAVATQRTGGTAPLDPGYAVGRFLGATTSPVTGYAGKPGSARGNLQGEKYAISDLKQQMMNEIKNAGSDPDAIREIVARYTPMFMRHKAKIEDIKNFMDTYGQEYQNDTGARP